MPHCSMNVKRFCALQQETVRQEPRPGSRDQDRRGPGALWPRWLERERVSNRENSPRLAAGERNAAPGQIEGTSGAGSDHEGPLALKNSMVTSRKPPTTSRWARKVRSC